MPTIHMPHILFLLTEEVSAKRGSKSSYLLNDHNNTTFLGFSVIFRRIFTFLAPKFREKISEILLTCFDWRATWMPCNIKQKCFFFILTTFFSWRIGPLLTSYHVFQNYYVFGSITYAFEIKKLAERVEKINVIFYGLIVANINGFSSLMNFVFQLWSRVWPFLRPRNEANFFRK